MSRGVSVAASVSSPAVCGENRAPSHPRRRHGRQNSGTFLLGRRHGEYSFALSSHWPLGRSRCTPVRLFAYKSESGEDIPQVSSTKRANVGSVSMQNHHSPNSQILGTKVVACDLQAVVDAEEKSAGGRQYRMAAMGLFGGLAGALSLTRVRPPTHLHSLPHHYQPPRHTTVATTLTNAEPNSLLLHNTPLIQTQHTLSPCDASLTAPHPMQILNLVSPLGTGGVKRFGDACPH
jgi:hypothetical protein